MTSLLDPLRDDTIRFLRIAADGYAAAGGRWPCWQWVRHQLWTQHRLDGEEILRGMPTWEYDYRPVRLGYRGQSVPNIADPVPLSIHGMAYVYSAVPAVSNLVRAFIAALGTAIALQGSMMMPMPTAPIQLEVTGDDFTSKINTSAGTDVTVEQLFDVLNSEPSTWRGVSLRNGQRVWDLTEVRLTPFASVRDVDEYLAVLDGVVAIPQAPPAPRYLPPMALPDAFDHLGLAWRVATGDRLFRIPRAAIPAKLTQPAASAEEFESRCSALADMLNAFDFPTEGGRLNNMKLRLAHLLGGAEAGRAQAAVDTLRSIFDLRAGQQHHGADIRSERAITALGLAQFGSDWTAAWDHLRVTVVEAFRTIREEIGTRVDQAET